MLTKLSSTLMLRIAAILSIGMGILYEPSVLNIYVPFIGSGDAVMDGQNYVTMWSYYALTGGFLMLAASFFVNRMSSVWLNRILLSASLMAGIAMIVAQLPALFWWILVSSGSFSWTGVLFFILHVLLLLVAMGQSFKTIFDIELSATKRFYKSRTRFMGDK